MKIEEAIKTLNEQHNFRDTPYAIKLDDALKLGIEALALVEYLRKVGIIEPLSRLVSETKT